MRLTKILCMGILALLCNIAIAQPPQYVFRVSFKDKQGSPSLSNPLAFLSQRSLDRRTKLGIGLDSTDQPVAPAYLSDVLTSTGAVLHTTSRWLNHCIILLEDSSKILQLQGKTYIAGINYISYYSPGLHQKGIVEDKFASERPKPAGQNKTTGSPGYYGANCYPQVQAVNGDYLHDFNYRGQGKLIAIMDAGFRYADSNPAFDSLRQSGRLKDVFNFGQNNTNVYDYDDHGASALSTMAAYVPGTYVGSAPLAEYALYRTELPNEQEMELENILAASERADSVGVDVISASIGYNEYFAPVARKFTYAEIDGKTTVAAKAANIATSKGILFVASAGNEGGTQWNRILSPGDADSALTIGNMDLATNVAGNSGWGPNGDSVIKPDVCMPGSPAIILRIGLSPETSYGTSFATSQIAGWAACLMQATSMPTPYRIRKAIIESAHLYPNYNYHAGYGMPNFYKAAEVLGVKEPTGTPTANHWLSVSPNPFKDDMTVKLYINTKTDAAVVLTDVSGKVMYRYEHTLYPGIVTLPVDARSLIPGIYFLKVTMGEAQEVRKLVKH